MTLSGRNGSGKTTLLRILAGEISADEGAVSLEKGARVALHDQRPPRAPGMTLRDVRLSGLEWVARDRARARAAGGGDGDRRDAGDAGRLRRRAGAAGARRRLPLARRRAATIRGLGFGDAELERDAGDVLRRRADPRVAGPGAGLAARPAAPRRADQPPRHRLARVARGATWATSTRRWSWWRTIAGSWSQSGRRCSSSSTGGRRFFAGPWHAWRAEKAARELALGRRRRAPQGRDRADGAVRRALPGEGDEGAPGAVEAEAHRAAEGAGDRGPAADERSLSFSFGAVERSGESRSSSRTANSRSASGCCSRTADVDRARGARLPDRARTAAASRRWSRPSSVVASSTGASSDRPQRRGRLPLPARRAPARRGAHGARPRSARDRALARRRRGRCSAASCSRATTWSKARRPPSPAARRSGSALRSSSRRARTC